MSFAWTKQNVKVSSSKYSPVCIVCLKSPSHPCPSCGLPLCKLQPCASGHRSECEDFFVRCKDEPLDVRYACVTPYRLFAAQEADQSLRSQLSQLMDHMDKLENDDDHRVVCDEARRLFHGQEEEVELFLRGFGILYINAVDTGELGRGRALFPQFSLLSHSCCNNSRHVIVQDHDKGRLNIRVYSQRQIQKGEEVTITYINLLRHTAERHRRLSRQWFFTCQCPRCEDPTELNTRINGVTCVTCREAVLLPESSTEWTCEGCGVCVAAQAVENVIDVFLQRLQSLTYKEEYEELLRLIASYFHPNHYLCVISKRYLIQLSDKAEEKLKYCRDLLELFDILDPGLSQTRGLTMLEMTMAEAATRKLSLEEIADKKAMIEKCLGVEPEGSYSKKRLEYLRRWL